VANEKPRHTFYIQLRCLEPLHLGTRHPYGQFRSGEATLRGGRMLAALAEGGLLFGGGNNIIVEDAPVLVKDGRFDDEVVHLPLTAETCKVFEGASWHDKDYLAQQDKTVPHGVWDTLLARWAVAKDWQDEWEWGWCLECERQTGKKGSTKPFPRFVQRRRKAGAEIEPRYVYEVVKSSVERRAHTALNPTRGTAEHGLLFADELVVPDTLFYLRIRVQGETPQELSEREEFIKNLAHRKLRLGGAKSRAHGLVEVTRIARDDEIPVTESLQERLSLFNKKVHRTAGSTPDVDRFYFTLTLQSPLVLPDQDVHPDWSIVEGDDGDWTLIFPGVAALPCARLEFFQHRFTQMTGWSTLWQLPKPSLRAFAAGSVYVFSTTADLTAIEPVAKEIEFSGAGIFRSEGFGAINISDQFHREVVNDGDST